MSICYFPLIFPFSLRSINVVLLLYRCLQQRKLLILLKGNNRLSTTGQDVLSRNSTMKSSLNFIDQQQLVSRFSLSTWLIILSPSLVISKVNVYVRSEDQQLFFLHTFMKITQRTNTKRFNLIITNGEDFSFSPLSLSLLHVLLDKIVL